MVTSVIYAGNYSGSFSGAGVSGNWQMTVNADGSISGSFTTASSTGNIVGVCHPDGFTFTVGTDNVSGTDIGMFGRITGADISGSWEADDGTSGTFATGAAVVPAGGPGGGGGGGGCFMDSLID